ncbi:uncharacterized protein CIMG_08762 [Coccidioides immitis RS]|uniref:DUF7721 domain-containing protein n=6 Tax=Coccidioides TaxID=5500 RepID=J3K653_COCIM|nr:uncharacterized protein CIMG_08762 [Coccidioides immitis RS]XP_003070579.1 hypothetical protein CPC735_063070 [Coccidioides posadasii C735 delta SOWgp]KMM68578.1 hypothetical protein CPAG_04904 [Coccidioides posadasii RMSCC 3488]KMP06973.1 hypothetical protein CIRG_06654 [Coccidioides immitis RMSCC 2394]KMU79944.1 hypothetical protein CISG_08226 [Coccidioides immitis RMSCC 3703]KMU86695.1 hypothetical protein CIHG_04484 [Coccidioides immitis H538.4]TPX22188.1 hypothetical protein DIZ76_014|eukprot:XP_003070579.1 hypothetical protein CPC735_063070 [Coccidioides posadasii C735 delta SOWgp]
MSNYSRPPNPAEYGGGGSSGANYYDPRADFSSQSQPYQQQSQYQGGSGGYNYDPAFSNAVKQAKYHNSGREDDDEDDEESGFFKKALSFISEHKDRFGQEDIDEQQVVGAHQALYGGGQQQQQQQQAERKHDADFLGNGAALQALKMFTSGEGQQSQTGGHDQNKLIGLAMAQAGKLWDQQNQQGNVATDKQSVINSAAKMALKMYLKNQAGGGGGALGGLGGLGGLASGVSGGGQSGGSGLLGLAKKFL